MKRDDTGYDGAALERLGALVGAPVAAAERCGWGFENETLLATLADGRRLIVKLLASRERAAAALRLAGDLPPRLAAAGIRAPHQLAADAAADPPYAVLEHIPGEPAAGFMGRPGGAAAVARAMGALLPQLARVPLAGADLDATWARPADLARQAAGQLGRCHALLGGAAAAQVHALIGALPAAFAGRPAVFAHGDFCPVNALIALEAPPRPALVVAGLVDLEWARLADPLFDAAWWGWVVRYHHAERWDTAWPALLAAAGIERGAVTEARVGMLQVLRCLELLDEHTRRQGGAAAPVWAERLRATLAWGAWPGAGL